jgi:hypothetical protein
MTPNFSDFVSGLRIRCDGKKVVLLIVFGNERKALIIDEMCCLHLMQEC